MAYKLKSPCSNCPFRTDIRPYLRPDRAEEILSHLRDREPAFRKFFAWANVFQDLGYPFGHRLDLGMAAKSCSLLGGA